MSNGAIAWQDGRVGSGKVTLQTIADTVGVSRMTVSNAFSKPDQLSSELRERILATASELGYAGPDPAARRLARGRAGTVGILLTDSLAYAFDDEIAARFVGAIAAELAPTGLAITLLTANDTGDAFPARDIPMDAALVYSCDHRSAAIDWLIRRRLPLVFVDQAPRPGYDSVNIDDRGGATLASRHLVELGHRRIGMITASLAGPVGLLDDPVASSGNAVGHQRVLGWLEGLADAGDEARPAVVQLDHFGESAGQEGARRLLDLEEPPTAILCVSDLAAVGAIEVLQSRGLSVPGDVSVVGFDGIQLAARMEPTLTTVRQDVERKGREAARALRARMAARFDGEPEPELRRVELPVELVVGRSTAPPPA